MKEYLTALIVLVIGIALLPVVQAFVDSANVSGSTATLLDLVPLFWVISIVAAAAVLAYKAFSK